MKGILVALVELEVPPFLAAYNGHHRRPYFLMDLLYKHPVESGLESQEPHSVNIKYVATMINYLKYNYTIIIIYNNTVRNSLPL